LSDKQKKIMKYLIDLNKQITSDQFKSGLAKTIELDKWNIVLMKSRELEIEKKDIVYLKRR